MAGADQPEVGNRGHVTLGFGQGPWQRPRSRSGHPQSSLRGPDGLRRRARAGRRRRDEAAHTGSRSRSPMRWMPSERSRRRAAARSRRCPGKDVESAAATSRARAFGRAFPSRLHGSGRGEGPGSPQGPSTERHGTGNGAALGEPPPSAQPAARARENSRNISPPTAIRRRKQAVMEARSAPGLVVEGPPGTGKSQTIVNMVADSIGRGKSLLVICQKQAALDVVRKRLEREKLGERIVMLTDINRDREPVVRAVREQVQALHMRPAGGAPAMEAGARAPRRADRSARRRARQASSRLASRRRPHGTDLPNVARRTYRARSGTAAAAQASRRCAPVCRASTRGGRDDRGKLRAAREILAACEIRRQRAVRPQDVQPGPGLARCVHRGAQGFRQRGSATARP